MCKLSWHTKTISPPRFSDYLRTKVVLQRDDSLGADYNGAMQERLQKILSAHGICSRRKAEEYLQEGRIAVNGTIATLGQKADPTCDTITVDGKDIKEGRGAESEHLYYLINKPKGVVTTNANRKEQKTIRDLLPQKLQGKIYPVGRLDKDTEGLLLLTNDGVLAYRLTHPSFEHEKEYEVMTTNPITDGQLRKLSRGMTISGEKTKEATVKRTGSSKFRIALTEGKNRQIRRMCQKVGAPVEDLRRIRIVTLKDTSLQEGEMRALEDEEKAVLLNALEIAPPDQS